MNFFDPDVPAHIREQIYRQNASFCMADSERAKFFGLPDGCRIRESAKIISPENLSIGVNCWIGEGAIIDASGKLTIGDNTSIGLSVFIWTHDSHRLNIRGTNTREHNQKIARKETSVGSNCFIAGPSVIMPGVKIGDKCVIGPMSVVYEDLPDRTIYQPYKTMLTMQGEIDELKRELSELRAEIRK